MGMIRSIPDAKTTLQLHESHSRPERPPVGYAHSPCERHSRRWRASAPDGFAARLHRPSRRSSFAEPVEEGVSLRISPWRYSEITLEGAFNYVPIDLRQGVISVCTAWIWGYRSRH